MDAPFPLTLDPSPLGRGKRVPPHPDPLPKGEGAAIERVRSERALGGGFSFGFQDNNIIIIWFAVSIDFRMAVGGRRWLGRVFELLVNGGLTLVGEFEGFGQVTSAAAKRGQRADEGGQKLRPLVKQSQSAFGIEFGKDDGQLIAGEQDGIVLYAINVHGPGGAFEGLWEGMAAFGFLLLLEPMSETAVFPVRDVGRADAGVAPGTKPMGNVGIGTASTKHLVHVVANFRGKRGDLPIAGTGTNGA